jgi:tRNA (guanine-N7-)-methyltransferase
MSRGLQTQLVKSRHIPNPTYYVSALLEDYSNWAFDEERCIDFRGRWRPVVFQSSVATPLDVEIGTGIGTHFTHLAVKNPERNLVGFEVKFKPLIQSIRRVLRAGGENARMVRYNATQLEDVFAPGEINNVHIHFPDPWQKKRGTEKHRLFHGDFLHMLFALQRPGSLVEIKTDSRSYFDFVLSKVLRSLYKTERQTFDLHQSAWAAENHKTPFEEYFLKESIPINYIRLLR